MWVLTHSKENQKYGRILSIVGQVWHRFGSQFATLYGARLCCGKVSMPSLKSFKVLGFLCKVLRP